MVDYIELLGIAASLLVLASFILSGEIKIRTVNLFGSILFVVYGIMIGSISIWFLNIILFAVHYYKLIQLDKNKAKKNK